MRAIALAIGAAAAAVPLLAQAPQTAFKSTIHAVPIDVSVYDGTRAVPALVAADFEVLDNGVKQTLSGAQRNTLPLDLRLLFDTSGSITSDDLEKYRRAMDRVAAALRPDDRIEILTFNGRIAEIVPLQHPPVQIKLDRQGPDGTSFFDAVSLAMITRPQSDRRQITIVLSDAVDTASFFDKDTLYDAAKRTHAVVYTVLPIALAKDTSRFSARLDTLARVTGGHLVRANWDARIGSRVIEALEAFRQGYVLYYTPTGVPLEGWHTITVRVPGARRYTVRAREGYFGK
jgi:VWFA-related protein